MLAGRLLLQQRAASKITFPRVWTNTCCSHPLADGPLREQDSDADVASGAVPGARRAAVRKLGHELGIPPDQLPPSQFRHVMRPLAAWPFGHRAILACLDREASSR